MLPDVRRRLSVTVRPECGSFAFQGSSASIRLILWSGMRARVLASPAYGSTPLSLAGSINVSAIAADLPPVSDPTKRWFLRREGDGAHRAFDARRAPPPLGLNQWRSHGGFLNQWRTIPRSSDNGGHWLALSISRMP